MNAKAKRSPWRVKSYMRDGRLWEDQPAADEAEAREIAANMGTIHGQKGWTNEVYGPDGFVAAYRGGKQVRP